LIQGRNKCVALRISTKNQECELVFLIKNCIFNLVNGFSKIPQTDFPLTCATGYSFAFNGMEKDDEVKGTGNSLDFGARIYDPRLGKYLSIDPMTDKFPYQSAYIHAGNNPIYYIDKNGEFKISPEIQKNYPLVYKYLSTQLEKDVEKSASIYMAFQNRTNATREDIANDFKNNSVVELISESSPGFDDTGIPSDAVEFYSNSKKAIEINEKLLGYVESKLQNSKSTKLDKQQALLILNMAIFHSEAHRLEDNFGMNDDEAGKSYAPYEPGFDVEYMIYGISKGHRKENENKENKIPGVRSKNDKLKVGVKEKIIKE
jgi:RHS repeat-associated protein